MPRGGEMVKVDNLQKNYGGFKLNISMEAVEGRVTAVVGKNGAGKTTLIKAILGMIRPDGGSTEIFGISSDRLTAEEKLRIGVTLADSGFSNELSVEDVICILRKAYPSFNEELYRRLCKEERVDTKKQLRKLSTGMKTKIRVFNAITHKADFLVLDEPTAGLDVDARNHILDLLREFMEEDERRSILITSHIASDIENISDEIYLIDNGRILLHEETGNILDYYGVVKVRDEDYEDLDKQYILCSRKGSFGYECLTSAKQFYAENYPNAVVENSGIDDLIIMMTGGK